MALAFFCVIPLRSRTSNNSQRLPSACNSPCCGPARQALLTHFPACSRGLPQKHRDTQNDGTGAHAIFVGSPHPVTSLQVAHLQQEGDSIDSAIHRIPSTDGSEQDLVAAFNASPVGALILTGGDTAAFVLRALGAAQIELAGEIARGIPWGFVMGGVADGCAVVTKSGGFGERDALVHAFEFCERRLYEKA